MPGKDAARPSRPPVLAYLVLACLFVISVATHVRFFVDLTKDLRLQYAFAWMVLGSPWPTIRWADGPAAAAGLRPGDRVLALNGQAPRGRKDQARLEQQLGPGAPLSVTVERNGQPKTVQVYLRPFRTKVGPVILLFGAVVWIALPILCLSLGFGVALIRPRDRLAWLLLGVLLGFGQNASSGNVNPAGWEDWIRVPAITYAYLASRTWTLWLMLFGIYFPKPLAAEQRVWWAKWLLLGPLLAYAAANAVLQVTYIEHFEATNGWGPWVTALATPYQIASMFTVGIFYAVSFAKAFNQKTDPDSRRRLRLLLTGSLVGLTPIFILLVNSLIRRQPLADDVPLVIALMMMFLFPVTLAYLVVVHRALDVRVVVRQGMQYALASGSVRAVQGVLTVVVAIFAVRLLENPQAHTLTRVTIISGSVVAVILMRRGAKRLRDWIDRRFFREAYRAEQLVGELLTEVHQVVETRPLLETVSRRIAESLHVTQVAIFMREGNAFAPAYLLDQDGAQPTAFASDAPTVQQLLATREPIRVSFDDPAYVHQSNGDFVQLRALESNLLLPLPARNQLLGFISLGPKRSEEPYSHADVKLLQSVAAQTGLALENTRLVEQVAAEAVRRERLSRELEIAREVQMRLLPQKQPAIEGLDYAGTCRPALEVGGDYYDFLALPDGQFGVAIGDVSGKGVPAALLMAGLQAGLRGQTVDGVADVSRLMSNLNRFLYDSTPRSHFATFFYAQYDPATGELRYSNAGHNPPLLLRGSEVVHLTACGPGLGLTRLSKYCSASIGLQPGDRLVLFTDGVTEAMNPELVEWGDEGLLTAAQACPEKSAALAVSHILRASDLFAAGAPQHDDMTLVILQVH